MDNKKVHARESKVFVPLYRCCFIYVQKQRDRERERNERNVRNVRNGREREKKKRRRSRSRALTKLRRFVFFGAFQAKLALFIAPHFPEERRDRHQSRLLSLSLRTKQ